MCRHLMFQHHILIHLNLCLQTDAAEDLLQHFDTQTVSIPAIAKGGVSAWSCLAGTGSYTYTFPTAQNYLCAFDAALSAKDANSPLPLDSSHPPDKPRLHGPTFLREQQERVRACHDNLSPLSALPVLLTFLGYIIGPCVRRSDEVLSLLKTCLELIAHDTSDTYPDPEVQPQAKVRYDGDPLDPADIHGSALKVLHSLSRPYRDELKAACARLQLKQLKTFEEVAAEVILLSPQVITRAMREGDVRPPLSLVDTNMPAKEYKIIQLPTPAVRHVVLLPLAVDCCFLALAEVLSCCHVRRRWECYLQASRVAWSSTTSARTLRRPSARTTAGTSSSSKI